MSTSSLQSSEVNALRANPFHVLGATTRDDRARIIELADERSLVVDEDACRAARNLLTNLRSRLAVELAWLPGVAPARAGQIVDELTGLNSFPTTELPALARANVLASVIQTLGEESDKRTVNAMILQLAASIDEVDLDEVVRYLNEDRSIAGFPGVKDTTACQAEFESLKRLYRDAVRDLLDRFPTKILVQVMTTLVDEATERGTRHPSALVDDLVDAYETAAQGFVEQEFEVLAALLKRARETVERGEDYVLRVFGDIERSALNFNAVAKPVQTARHASGMLHQPSRDVATAIRALSVDMHNNHHWLKLPSRVTDFLGAHFGSVDEVTDNVETDRAYLSQVLEQQRKTKEQTEEFNRSITYSADIGTIGKSRFEISPNGVSWQGQRFALESITRMRWGGTRHSVNGVPTGTSYQVFVGTDTSSFVMNLRNQDIYSNIVDRLWRAAGVNIVAAYVDQLKKTGQFSLPGLVVRDDQVFLSRSKLFTKNEIVPVAWADVRIQSSGGNFQIFDVNDRKACATFSYQNHDNIHALERLIRFYFEGKKRKISEVFEP